MDEKVPEKKGRPNLSRILLIAALVFFFILFLRELGLLASSGRLF